MKKILVLDDHPLVASGLSSLIETNIPDCDVSCCQSFSNAEILLAENDFQLSILDINFPDQLVFDYLKKTQYRHKFGFLVFVSAQVTDYYIERALQLEASGFLSKQDDPEFILDSIVSILRGQKVCSKSVIRRLDNSVHTTNFDKSKMLTGRELEVMKFLAQGNSKKQISETLEISIKTVDRHCCNLMEKLELHSQLEVSHFAIRQGIVSL